MGKTNTSNKPVKTIPSWKQHLAYVKPSNYGEAK